MVMNGLNEDEVCDFVAFTENKVNLNFMRSFCVLGNVQLLSIEYTHSYSFSFSSSI